MRRTTIAILVASLVAAVPAAAQELVTISWDATPPLAGRVIEDAEIGGPVLALENEAGGPLTTTFAKIEDPGVTGSSYAVRGKVRYEGVTGVGYLEMWSVFPDGGQYFSRTLADVGPMQKLSGSHGWREFVLPFSLLDAPQRPNLLILNLTLEGGGAVFLGPLRLVQYANDDEMMGVGAGGADAPRGAPPGWRPGTGATLLMLGGLVLLLVSGLAFRLGQRRGARQREEQ